MGCINIGQFWQIVISIVDILLPYISATLLQLEIIFFVRYYVSTFLETMASNGQELPSELANVNDHGVFLPYTNGYGVRYDLKSVMENENLMKGFAAGNATVSTWSDTMALIPIGVMYVENLVKPLVFIENQKKGLCNDIYYNFAFAFFSSKRERDGFILKTMKSLYGDALVNDNILDAFSADDVKKHVPEKVVEEANDRLQNKFILEKYEEFAKGSTPMEFEEGSMYVFYLLRTTAMYMLKKKAGFSVSAITEKSSSSQINMDINGYSGDWAFMSVKKRDIENFSSSVKTLNGDHYVAVYRELLDGMKMWYGYFGKSVEDYITFLDKSYNRNTNSISNIADNLAAAAAAITKSMDLSRPIPLTWGYKTIPSFEEYDGINGIIHHLNFLTSPRSFCNTMEYSNMAGAKQKIGFVSDDLIATARMYKNCYGSRTWIKYYITVASLYIGRKRHQFLEGCQTCGATVCPNKVVLNLTSNIVNPLVKKLSTNLSNKPTKRSDFVGMYISSNLTGLEEIGEIKSNKEYGSDEAKKEAKLMGEYPKLYASLIEEFADPTTKYCDAKVSTVVVRKFVKNCIKDIGRIVERIESTVSELKHVHGSGAKLKNKDSMIMGGVTRCQTNAGTLYHTGNTGAYVNRTLIGQLQMLCVSDNVDNGKSYIDLCYELDKSISDIKSGFQFKTVNDAKVVFGVKKVSVKKYHLTPTKDSMDNQVSIFDEPATVSASIDDKCCLSSTFKLKKMYGKVEKTSFGANISLSSGEQSGTTSAAQSLCTLIKRCFSRVSRPKITPQQRKELEKIAHEEIKSVVGNSLDVLDIIANVLRHYPQYSASFDSWADLIRKVYVSYVYRVLEYVPTGFDDAKKIVATWNFPYLYKPVNEYCERTHKMLVKNVIGYPSTELLGDKMFTTEVEFNQFVNKEDKTSYKGFVLEMRSKIDCNYVLGKTRDQGTTRGTHCSVYYATVTSRSRTEAKVENYWHTFTGFVANNDDDNMIKYLKNNHKDLAIHFAVAVFEEEFVKDNLADILRGDHNDVILNNVDYVIGLDSNVQADFEMNSLAYEAIKIMLETLGDEETMNDKLDTLTDESDITDIVPSGTKRTHDDNDENDGEDDAASTSSEKRQKIGDESSEEENVAEDDDQIDM